MLRSCSIAHWLELHRLLSLCAAIYCLSDLEDLHAGTLRAGAATGNITPQLGIEINGGTHPIIASYVHDELQVRCLVLDDAQIKLGIVVVDNCLIDRALIDQAKALIFAHTKMHSNSVSISATHTHSAGSVTGVHLTEPDASYRAWLPSRIADTVRNAVARLQPAQIAWGSGSVPQHVFNRRITVKSGFAYTNLLGRTGDAVKMNWSSPEPAVDGTFSAPVDPELFVLSVQAMDGKPLSIVANYSLHYVGGVGPGHLSADYYGVFCSKVAELLQAEKQEPPFVAIMSNGTSGDVNNNDFRTSRGSQAPYSQMRRVAEDIARETLNVMGRLDYRPELRLVSRSSELQLAVRKPTTADVETARGMIHGRGREQLRTWPEFYAREQIILSRYPDSIALPLQIFKIGELSIVQWPGEIFASTGLELKHASLGKPLFNISLANGWFGYIPPPEQHALGAYETWRGRTSLLETNAIPRLLKAYLGLLQDPW